MNLIELHHTKFLSVRQPDTFPKEGLPEADNQRFRNNSRTGSRVAVSQERLRLFNKSFSESVISASRISGSPGGVFEGS
jgi:hypothetical protein